MAVSAGQKQSLKFAYISITQFYKRGAVFYLFIEVYLYVFRYSVLLNTYDSLMKRIVFKPWTGLVSFFFSLICYKLL